MDARSRPTPNGRWSTRSACSTAGTRLALLVDQIGDTAGGADWPAPVRATGEFLRAARDLPDVYQPDRDTNTERPAIVWVHGGSFSGGDKTSDEIVIEATEMAKKGYVSVSINYRLYGPGCSAVGGNVAGCVQAMIDAQHDAQAAVRFLRQNATNYRIDTERMAIGGTSAGAITALHVGANADDPGISGNPGFSSAVQAAVSLSGARLLGPPQSTGDAPSLMFHGTADAVVPYQWAVNTLDEAHAAGLVSYLTSYPGEGHLLFDQHDEQIMAQTTNFLYWLLELPNASG